LVDGKAWDRHGGITGRFLLVLEDLKKLFLFLKVKIIVI
jgi:hypothetical protein